MATPTLTTRALGEMYERDAINAVMGGFKTLTTPGGDPHGDRDGHRSSSQLCGSVRDAPSVVRPVSRSTPTAVSAYLAPMADPAFL